MRIAVLAPPWLAVPPVGYGGTELVLDTLCRGLAEAGHEVLLYATGDSTCPVERAWTFDTEVGVHRASPVSELRQVIDGYEAADAWVADIVHDHTITGLAWSAQFADLRVVTTNHGPFESDLGAVYRSVGDRVPIIAISNHQAASAGDIPVAAVIHHGVDRAAHKPGDGSGGYAAFLGRMSPDKGVHTAIAVARRAGIPLRIAAKMREPLEREYFQSQVRPFLGDDVEFLGEVAGEDKCELLRGAACLLNPIAWPEPFGMVMIEALVHGTPVVATPAGAAPELVDDGITGILASDEDSLVDAVSRIGEIDRQVCRKAVEQRFSMERMAADHVALYERHAGPGRPTFASATTRS